MRSMTGNLDTATVLDETLLSSFAFAGFWNEKHVGQVYRDTTRSAFHRHFQDDRKNSIGPSQ